MSRLSMELAQPEDDAELRRLSEAIGMEGALDIRFLREPSYREAAEVEGELIATLVARDNAKGRVVGMGTMSSKRCYVNGEPMQVGYMCGIRGLPEVRKGALLGRGFTFSREVHEGWQTPFYLSTIIEDNHLARKILTSGRASLPLYRDIGRFKTFAYNCKTYEIPSPPEGTEIRKATADDIDALVEFLNREGPRRQFFPVYRKEHILSDSGLLRGLNTDDIYIAATSGRIVGTLGVWDQRPFRQSKLVGYHGVMFCGRHLYNLWARLKGRNPLPEQNTIIKQKSLALVCIQNDSVDVFDSLLGTVLLGSMTDSNCHYVTLGLHERDPLVEVARRRSHLLYLSRLYVVHWADDSEAFDSIDTRTPYLELGGL